MVPKKKTKVVDIDFNPNLFNNVYWHLLRAFDNLLIRYIWLYGGSSASKTYSVVQLQIVKMLSGENENALVLRKFAVDIKDSIFADFESIIADWGIKHLFIIQQNFIKCIVTGSYVRFRGLDDSEKIKGISRFKRVIMEEVSQFDEIDLKQIRKRLRGKVGQQIICIFNPISEEHWIKEKIFDVENLIEQDSDISGMWVNEKGNLVVMKTNYLDNCFIVGRWAVNEAGELVQIGGFVDQHVIDDFEHDKIRDNNYYQIYGLGNWGKLRVGGEFWKDFNPNTHIVNAVWDEDHPLHISWDENVNPYLTCLIWQIIHEKQSDNSVLKRIIQIDEICLPDPRNRVSHVSAEFIKRYPQQRVKGLFVYGDRTSIKEDTKLEKGENFFTKIIQNLQNYSPTLRMQSVNPSIVQSGGFINEIYAGNIPGLSIEIGTKCNKSIYDYQYALEDSDGTLKKSKKTNPVTKVQYEEFGHPSDAKRYLITVAFANEYQEYLRGGKKVKVVSGRAISKNSY
ncbi:PBSX family phage terminase large subunit [Mucilaginibacter gossypii]|uniref:PBSX family phage terminase large subunit n=1 Tax=Mucilaginibacter gossypii TaxID=551996 RepID=UPI000DCE69D2|nr:MULTISPECIES: PBSX family phage terminase large subunit [Mucilaginibacter]QTE37494.1 PBSX family phage terminase large subunit [Mucilaginibacter gossypii]RAV52319.1 PBSX family phage terminase large subunit [Mucilaginibacter rubeus]